MFFESQSAALASVIEQGAAISTATQWRAVLEEAEKWKPIGFNPAQADLRHYYEGRFGPHLDGAVGIRYPNTGHRMPRTPLNWAKLFAENAASVFDLPPTFYLEAEDGSRLTSEPPADATSGAVDASDAQRADDFADMVDESQLQMNLAEAERRATICGDCFIRVDSAIVEAAATGDPAITRLTMFYPEDMSIIPHPKAPATLACALAIIARISSDDGIGGQSWEAWTRTATPDDKGVPVFGAWRCEIVTQRAKLVKDALGRQSIDYDVTTVTVWDPVTNPYPHTRAPWVAIRSGIAQGCPYVDPNRNLVQVFDTLNTSIMAEMFAVDMGSASALVRKTDAPAPAKIALGAGLLVNIRKAEDLIAVPQSTDFAGIRNSNAGLAAMLAITSRQPIGAFSVDATTAPKSGTALRIEREPQTKARLEAVARMRPAVRELLVIMCEIHDEHRATDILGSGAEPCWEPQDPPEYEDLQVTQQRAFQLLDAGKITDEMLLVMCRVAPDEETAKDILARAAAQKASKRPSAGMNALDAAIPPTNLSGRNFIPPAMDPNPPPSPPGGGAPPTPKPPVTVVTHTRGAPGGNG